MDSKIIKNYIYNILYQLVRIILPMVLVPYTYAHITPPVLGISSFASNIMSWFILFGILGVNTYGNREIAKVRDDPKKLNTAFFEIFYMQVLNMIIAMIAYYIFCFATVKENLYVYLLTGITMFATMCDITWLFYGLEDFKKASIRNIIVKILGVGLIFLLCKSPSDLWKYILINAGSELLGQFIMFAQLKEYISFEKVSIINAYKHHFKATFQLFVPTIAISVYTMLDQTMLGYLYSAEHLEFYKTSMNFVKMFLYFITSIGSVMLPRVTNVYYNDANGQEKAEALVNTTMKIALLLALPMCFGMIAVAPNLMAWYLPTAPIIAVLVCLGAPIVIFISMSNVTGIQFMVPTGMYKRYSASVISGAIINFILNLITIPKIGAYGAVASSVIAEASVTLIQFISVSKKVKINLNNKSYYVYLIGSLLMLAVVYFEGKVLPLNIIGTLVQVMTGAIIYLLILVVTKEELTQKVFSKLKGRKQNA